MSSALNTRLIGSIYNQSRKLSKQESQQQRVDRRTDRRAREAARRIRQRLYGRFFASVLCPLWRRDLRCVWRLGAPLDGEGCKRCARSWAAESDSPLAQRAMQFLRHRISLSLCSVFITPCVSLVLVRFGFLLSAIVGWFLVRLVELLIVVCWESLPC